jgi:DDE family transposase
MIGSLGARWWSYKSHFGGRRRYHSQWAIHIVTGQREVGICAHGGGSNGSRTRALEDRAGRPSRPADHRLPLPARHRPGTSKWNKIEHRLFSQISMNWRGRPLTSHEVIVSLIASTRSRTGLTVAAELDTGQYPKGIKISYQQMRDLEQGSLRRYDWHLNGTTASPPTPRPA